MNRKIYRGICVFVFIFLLTACEPDSSITPVPVMVTASITPSPVFTRIPTTTPFPSITPNIKTEAVKQVLLEYGIYGSQTNAVDPMEFFLGRDIPNLVVYTDGQVISNQSGTLLSSQLSASELCLLIGKIQRTGYFEAELFNGAQPPQTGDSSTIILLVNGSPTKLSFIPKNNLPFVSAPIANTLDLLNTYRLSQPVFFEPGRLLLWVEPVAPDAIKGIKINNWPLSLPAINQIWKDHTQPQVLIEGQNAVDILRLFDHRLQTLYFTQGTETYRVIARPLLPHETSIHYSIIPDRIEKFDLPVSCGAQAVYLPTQRPQTSTPSPQTTQVSTENQDHPTLSGLGRILFTSDRSGNQQIYMMNSDGSNLERLTNNLSNDDSPAWSPDGSQIAFISNRDGNDEIYVMNADGTNQQRLTRTIDDEAAPDWSPDGKHLVYTLRCNSLANCTGHQELYVMDTDGNNARQLTNTAYNAFLPAWSSNGAYIAFVLGNQLGSSIYIIDAAGGKISPLIDRTDINATMPDWSPDGLHLAYVVWNTSTYQSEIYEANADGSHQVQLTHLDSAISEPAWSPDGAWLAFSIQSKNQPDEHVMIISADPAQAAVGPIPFTSGPQNDTKPAWGR